MRTLLIESVPGCGHHVESTLQGAGHDVLRCYPPGSPGFPCAALDGGCPLETGPGVDVVAAVRAPAAREQTAAEMGVTCALRLAVPVVVIAEDVQGPFGDRVRPTTQRDVVASCEAAVDDAREAVAGPLRAEARRVAAAADLDPSLVDVRVDRRPGRTRLELVLPDGWGELADVMAVRIRDVYCAPATWRGSVDVEVARYEVDRGKVVSAGEAES